MLLAQRREGRRDEGRKEGEKEVQRGRRRVATIEDFMRGVRGRLMVVAKGGFGFGGCSVGGGRGRKVIIVSFGKDLRNCVCVWGRYGKYMYHESRQSGKGGL